MGHTDSTSSVIWTRFCTSLGTISFTRSESNSGKKARKLKEILEANLWASSSEMDRWKDLACVRVGYTEAARIRGS